MDMWIPQPIPQTLSQLRKEAQLTQHQLAQRSGVSPSRICNFEHGFRTPTVEELQRLVRALNLPLGQLRLLPAPPEGLAGLLDRFRREQPRQAVHPVYQRLVSLRAKYTDLVDPLLKQIGRRPDEEWCRHWLGQVPTDSCDELLPWLRLMGEVEQATPRLLSLQQIHFETYAVADLQTGRDRRDEVRPCLELPLQSDAVALLFPQVPLRTPTRGCRVDILAEIVAPRKRVTCVMEMDGAAHDSTFDERRSQALRLPTLRFSPREVLADRWVCEVTGALYAA